MTQPTAEEIRLALHMHYLIKTAPREDLDPCCLEIYLDKFKKKYNISDEMLASEYAKSYD